ncbi:MAG: hypothetical protein KF800_06890 [Lysobacter sp.]|nr:hypothetical protein [Lysobacter sp.]
MIAGESHALLSNPFESYRRQHPGLDLQPLDGVDTLCTLSSNHRGYVATFRIEGRRLLLDDIVTPACGEQASRSQRRTVFGLDEAVHAAWFTGVLVVPRGERVAYAHLGYGSVYQRYRLHRVEKGFVVETATMAADAYVAYRERQFRIHRTTQAYRDALASMLAEGDWSEEDAERFLFLADTDYATDIALAFEPPMQ